MSESLVLILYSYPPNDRLIYRYGDRYYDALNLTEIDPDQLPSSTPELLLSIYNSRGFTSTPVFIRTTNNWAIFSTNDAGQLLYLDGPSYPVPFSNESIIRIQPFLVPTINQTTEQLEELSLSPFRVSAFLRLRELQQNEQGLDQFNAPFPITIVPQPATETWLYYVQDQHRPAYQIRNEWYDAVNIEPIPTPQGNLVPITSIRPEEWIGSTEPLLVITEDGWILLTISGTIVATEGDLVHDNSHIRESFVIAIPDLSRHISGQYAPHMTVDQFDQDRFRDFLSGVTLGDAILREEEEEVEPEEDEPPIVEEQPQVSPAPRLEPSSDDLVKETLHALIQQLYGFPVNTPDFLIVNGLRMDFISIERAGEMIQGGEIVRWVLDSFLQPWAGPPGTSNSIVILIGKSGTSYLVKAQYDRNTNKIYPPK